MPGGGGQFADAAAVERAKAAGAPVQADISALRPGEKMTVEWRGKPVYVVRRTQEALDEVTDLDTVRVQVYECERDARSVQFFDPIVALLFRGMYYERCMRAHGYEKTPVE